MNLSSNQSNSLWNLAFRTIANRSYLVLATFVIFILCWQFEVSLFVPILVFAGAWLFRFGLKDKADCNALEMMRQSKPRHPGHWVAVCGKAVPLSPEITPIFDDVLAYRYRDSDVGRAPGTIGERGSARNRKHLSIRYDGFYLVPTGISTDTGVIKLAGFPDMTHSDKRTLPNGVTKRGEDIAQPNTYFVPRFVTRAYIVDQTSDQIDVVIKYADKPRTSTTNLDSRVLKQGDDICVFGKWNDGELLPSLNRPRGLPLYSGTAEDVHEQLKGMGKAFQVIGGIFLTIAAGVTVWSLV